MQRSELDPLELLHRIREGQAALAALVSTDGTKPRHWRTRKDPFEAVWYDVLRWLQHDPEALTHLWVLVMVTFIAEATGGKIIDGSQSLLISRKARAGWPALPKSPRNFIQPVSADLSPPLLMFIWLSMRFSSIGSTVISQRSGVSL